MKTTADALKVFNDLSLDYGKFSSLSRSNLEDEDKNKYKLMTRLLLHYMQNVQKKKL